MQMNVIRIYNKKTHTVLGREPLKCETKHAVIVASEGVRGRTSGALYVIKMLQFKYCNKNIFITKFVTYKYFFCGESQSQVK